MNNKGFTLVELAIVMVIMGLVTAAVIGGRDLLRSAELDSIIKDFNEYKSAVHTFEDKYSALPGDIIDANDIWAATDSGDGNNQVDTAGEQVNAWEQLVLAEMISGSYEGDDNPAETDQVPGVKIPPTKVSPSNTGYVLVFQSGIYGLSENMITVGRTLIPDPNPVTEAIDLGFINSTESWAIDRKSDDGRAATGNILTENGNGETGCLDLGPTPDEYDLDIAPPPETCILHFRLRN